MAMHGSSDVNTKSTMTKNNYTCMKMKVILHRKAPVRTFYTFKNACMQSYEVIQCVARVPRVGSAWNAETKSLRTRGDSVCITEVRGSPNSSHRSWLATDTFDSPSKKWPGNFQLVKRFSKYFNTGSIYL